MPRGAPRGSERAPRLAQWGSDKAPRRPQDGPGMLPSKCFLREFPKNTSHGCPQDARRGPKRSRQGPKTGPGDSESAPRRPQDGPGQLASKCFLRGLPKNTSHGCPKDTRRGPMRLREGPKTGPGGSERSPRRPQHGPGMLSSKCFLRRLPKNTSHGCHKKARRGPKRSRECPKTGPGNSERAPWRSQDGPGKLASKCF